LYSNKKPLVIIHDSLVGFVKISSLRPVVIKLHGDARLAPRSTGAETKSLDTQVARVIRNLLTERGIIFMGYGGNDKSIAGILEGLPGEALPHGVWWINNQTPVGPFGEWLGKRDAIWVKHLDFDELMLLIWHEFNFDHPDNKRFEKILDDYRKTFESLKKKIEEKPEEEKRKFERAIEDVVTKATDWWTIELEASKFRGSDPDRMETIYQEGIDKFPNSAPLLGNYALFLKDIRKDYGRAEEFYKRAVEADPNSANNLGNYANFLSYIRKDYDRAEEFYKRAVEADSNYAIHLGNYANFLKDVRKDYDRAEEFYKRAVEADPNHANNLGNYSGFLLAKGAKEDGFKTLEKALSLRSEENRTLLIECLFYRYAHSSDKRVMQESLNKIRELLKAGVRSPGWNLDDNVKRGIEDGHPDPEFLRSLAGVITEKEDIKVLDGFKAWKELS
jgi:tetratricopeptide (TPR) repeat protein